MFIAVIAETISACNRTCWFCKHGQPRRTRDRVPLNEIMSWDTIDNIVKKLAEISFSGRLSWQRINEPLLDRRLPDIIRFSRQNLPQAHLSITTNGDFLDQYIADQLFISGLNHLTITAYDNDVYKKYSQLDLHSSNLKDKRGDIQNWDNRGGNIPILKVRNKVVGCLRPSTAMNIVPNGDVLLCCADFYGDVIFGNINEATIPSIWESGYYQKYRSKLEHGRQGLTLCEDCNYDGRGHEKKGNIH